MKSTHVMIARSLFKTRRSCVAALACLAALAGVSTQASAATFTVTTTNDSGGGSLRDMITAANAAAGADEIVFTAGLNGVIALGSDLPAITETLTITGPGPRNMTISGGNARRVLLADATLNISGLRLANGFTDRGAGLRFNAAGGMLTVRDCHFDQNTVTDEGGAIVIIAGSFDVERVTFTTDQAAGAGGCIWWGQGGGTPTGRVVNCTFVNNFASQFGGALRQFNATAYAVEVTNCTFVVNNAGQGGGAIAVNGGTMTLRNTLFTANAAGGNPGGHLLDQTAGGAITSLGNNLFGNMNGSNVVPDASDKFGVIGNELNTGVLIAFPFNNGGLTDTTPLLATSIAIDGGNANGAPVTDQRGFIRVGCSTDVGAFEVQTVTDTDGDGVINCLDTCPNTPACASVNQTGCPTDGDADGVFDGCDTCPGTLAGDPVGANGCSTADEDADGVLNDADLCRGTPACALASVLANGCPADADGDGLFDGCDNCPGGNDLTDTDADGIPDCLDACPAAGDSDADGVQDCQDLCPADPLKIAPGACGCGNVDTDTDADGAADCIDLCPADPLKIAPGTCGCGNVDTDLDGDGVPNCVDGCVNDPLKLDPGVCGCGVPDADADADGVLDCIDTCPATPACAAVNETGCPVDSDADGVFDGCDQCPGTFAGDPVNANGCSTADEDGDGVLNDADPCRGTPVCARASAAATGCPVDADADGLFDGCDNCLGQNDLLDTDGDKIPDCLDTCPLVEDTDDDGVQDCVDQCPNDPFKRDPGSCGCGNPDADTNGNGIPDCIDPAPPAPQPAPAPTGGLQPFIPITPLFPGGLACGYGLMVPMMLMVPGLMLIGGAIRRKRRG